MVPHKPIKTHNIPASEQLGQLKNSPWQDTETPTLNDQQLIAVVWQS